MVSFIPRVWSWIRLEKTTGLQGESLPAQLLRLSLFCLFILGDSDRLLTNL